MCEIRRKVQTSGGDLQKRKKNPEIGKICFKG